MYDEILEMRQQRMQSTKGTHSSAMPLAMLISSMLIYGTIGIFRRYLPLSSGILAFARGIIGALFLWAFLLVRGQRFDWAAVKKKLLPLTISGAWMGFNWIFLFESYRYTSVATATLCYYMEPVLVILVSPLFFREKLTPRKMLCVAVAMVGMVFVSGVADHGIPAAGELTGILFGLSAALLYAAVVIMNKKITGVGIYEKTIVQLLAASIILIPYLAVTEDFSGLSVTAGSVLILLIVGVVHTGLAYMLYFGSIERLPAQTVALLSYIDPVTAIILSALVLHEKMTVFGVLGAVMILGATILCELRTNK